MIQNQKSHATKYDRYPEIFKEVSSIIPNPNKILSFGCSTGLECNTLHEVYFSDSKITGLDISEDIINKNKESNKFENIEYISNVNKITEKFDLIFAMSVLCNWYGQGLEGEYPFQTFKDTLNLIDKLLEKKWLSLYL